MININVNIESKNIISFNIDEMKQIKELKKLICDKLFIFPCSFWLHYNGNVLLDEYLIVNYLESDTTIDLNYRNKEYIKLITKDDVFYVDLNMILDSDDLDLFLLEDLIYDFNLNKNYLNNETYCLWCEFFKLTYYLPEFKTFDDLLEKDSIKRYFKDLSYNNLLNLCNLFDCLKLKLFQDIHCFYFTKEYLLKYIIGENDNLIM